MHTFRLIWDKYCDAISVQFHHAIWFSDYVKVTRIVYDVDKGGMRIDKWQGRNNWVPMRKIKFRAGVAPNVAEEKARRELRKYTHK